jgi:hypothetical protein
MAVSCILVLDGVVTWRKCRWRYHANFYGRRLYILYVVIIIIPYCRLTISFISTIVLSMASFFGEVVHPVSRAFWNEDDEDLDEDILENTEDTM